MIKNPCANIECMTESSNIYSHECPPSTPSPQSYDGLDEAPALAPEGIAGSLPTPAFEEDEEEEEEEGEVDSEGTCNP